MSYAHPPDGPDSGTASFLAISFLLVIGLVLASCAFTPPATTPIETYLTDTEEEARKHCFGRLGCAIVTPEKCTVVAPYDRHDIIIHELRHCREGAYHP